MPIDRELSANQQLLAEYLLQQIGFSIGPFTEQYLQAFYRFSHFDDYDDVVVYVNIAIEVLYQEVNARRSLHAHLRSYRTNNITASEIENFTFCPAAYSIAATFHIPRTKSSIIGSDLHEKEILNPGFKKLGPRYGLSAHLTVTNDEVLRTYWEDYFQEKDADFVNDIKNSELLYSDGIRSTDEPFHSRTGSVIGRPDYVFRNKSTGLIFVVEEKFSLMTARKGQGSIAFYRNHTNQVRAYIYGIAEYNIGYGYLIYWRYRYENLLPLIKYAASKKIEKTEEARKELVNIYQSIQSVIRQGEGQFSNGDRHPRKCANCGASIFCGHKTGKFDTYKFPYALEHAFLQKVEYPTLLIKRSKKETIQFENQTLSIKERIFKRYYDVLVSALNIPPSPVNLANYQVEWSVEDGKLYLLGFSFYTSTINGRREVLREYSGDRNEVHFMHFISTMVTCYKKIESDQDNTDEQYEEIHLRIAKGMIELI